jgi:FtsP/CotA-like multicopper oxidase with cupredoxin domain
MHALPYRNCQRIFLIAAAFALSVVLGSFPATQAQQAQPAVHPFEQPPVLEETAPNAPAMKFLRLQVAPSEETCHPQGSVTRTGNDVYVKLKVVRANFTINNPDPDDPYGGNDPVELRSYGGCHAGPTIEVLPGNTLHIDLINSLSTNDPSCLPFPQNGLNLPAGVGCFNTINLHTHGLHVSPAGNSDNVLLSIAPQTEFPYEINVPGDHPAGTFWYHAHRHGSTATQVASGESGILVIRGTRPYTAPTPANPHPIADIDSILHDASGVLMKEQLFLLQQIPYACFSGSPDPNVIWPAIYTTKGLYDANSDSKDPKGPANAPWICPKGDPKNSASVGVVENFNLQMFSSTIWDTNGRFTSVNGIVEPTLTIKAGEIQRWRFVHAGIHDTINLQVVRATGGPSAEAKFRSLIANSALVGNRVEQEGAVEATCVANEKTLIPQFEIAVDGLTRKHIERVGYGGDAVSNYLQPGYRSDILAVFPEDGDYCLLDQAAPPDQRANPTKGTGGGQGPSKPQLLAYVHVRGGKAVAGDLQEYVQHSLFDANPELPEPIRQNLLAGDISPWAQFIELPQPPAANPRKADFAINFPKFQINGKSYKPDVVNIKRQVNTSDDWILTAKGEPHIFHIHVNPFEIIDVTHLENGAQVSIFDKDGHCKKDKPDSLQNQYCSLYHTFRDTIFVENNYQVHARTYYDRYIGEFVIHCHILDHEDAGMMLNIEIKPNLNAPGGGIGMAGMHSDKPMPGEVRGASLLPR